MKKIVAILCLAFSNFLCSSDGKEEMFYRVTCVNNIGLDAMFQARCAHDSGNRYCCLGTQMRYSNLSHVPCNGRMTFNIPQGAVYFMITVNEKPVGGPGKKGRFHVDHDYEMRINPFDKKHGFFPIDE